MKTDSQIQAEVITGFSAGPFLHAAEIGVSVHNGIVTLSGRVDSYLKKRAAELAAKRISGIRGIADEIQVGVSPADQRSDEEIAEAVADALQDNPAFNKEQIKILVEDGIVRMEGETDWNCDHTTALSVVEHLPGIRYITDLVTLKRKVCEQDVNTRINKYLHDKNAVDIQARVEGPDVTIRGSVHSDVDKKTIGDIVWAIPGVRKIDNQIVVIVS